MIKSLLYVYIATALVTIAPFLITFEKGQDIIHGLFGFSALILLLLYTFVRTTRPPYKYFSLVLIFICLMLVCFLDLKNILSYKDGLVGWYVFIPIISVAIAVVVLKPVKAIPLHKISLVTFLSFVLHLFTAEYTAGQPLFEFPVLRALPRLTPYTPSRDCLLDDFKVRYYATDSVSVTRQFIDTTRTNVVILVESWGIPMDTNRFNSELSLFGKNLMRYGVHYRMYSRTRTAEREDLLDSIGRDSLGHRDSLFIPNQLVVLGYKTTFLFGGDSLIQHRDKYIRNIGFENVIFMDSDVSDGIMAAKVDSLLVDTAQKQLITWTTHDTGFPMGENGAIGESQAVETLYFERLNTTLARIASLGAKYPKVRFIVQGDHEPILSPLEFQQKFYRRWVPFVVLN